ncbi:hypothetical protein B5X24_HaOG215155 [Helicoverpa armigera]|nr:hypothetical protein B5X24_HaOG215155 [Helicoverpa armigera]
MANLVLVVFLTSQLICAVFSLPPSARDSTVSVSPVVDLGRGSVKTLLLKFFEADVKVGGKGFRSRRSVINENSCPSGTIWYANQCMTREKYNQTTGDEE